MNKTFKTPIRNFLFHNILKCQKRFKISNGVKILIISIAIFGIGFSLIPLTSAQANGLDVEFEGEPESLFNEANFLPGQSVTRWVKVTNNSGEDQEIGVNVTGSSDCSGAYCLSDELNLVISKNSTPLYTGSLTDFFEAGEIYLSHLPNGANIQYDFSITFTHGAGNNYQGLSTSFNFEIGFWGESIGEEIPPGGPGGGGVIIAGLVISNEDVSGVGTTSITITWDTNKKATSRVIYSSSNESYVFDWKKPPNYGYFHSTPEYDTPANLHGVMDHTVDITGLSTGTTYYYRCVSHTSPDETISTEHSFTTLGTKEEGPGEEETPPSEVPGEIPEEEFPAPPAERPGEITPPTGGEEVPGGEEIALEPSPEEEVTISGGEMPEEKPETNFDKFLAAIGGFFTFENPCWIFFLGIVILIILFLLSEKKREGKRKWGLPLLILVAIILYCIFCRPTCWILIITAVILLILSVIFKSKKKEKESGF